MGENVNGLPEDLTALSEEELATHEGNLVEQFDTLFADENLDDAGLATLTKLGQQINALRTETSDRVVRAEQRANSMAELQALVHGDSVDETAEITDEVEAEVQDEQSTQEPALVAGGATTTPRITGRKLNPTLAEIRQHAPKVAPPARAANNAVLVASADIPGFTHASKLPDMASLVAAMQARAKTLTDGRGAHNYVPVAQMQRKYRHVLGPDAMPDDIDRVLQEVTDVNALVAAGGWCAPSEISYDFYNIVCEDGMLDLPTVGINRGGIRWPVSPSFGDLVGNEALWSWTETQDIAAATGTAQSGTKTCGRVPCPTFDEERLQCDGLCLTVGNLMDDAYPELIANHTRLLFAAHAHKMNGLWIQRLVSLSGSDTTVGSAGSGVVAPLIGAISLAAIDYREKYAMCEDAVLEVILPRWIRAMMRSDLRKRTGVDLLDVNDSRLMAMFDAENVRVQWVNDWQVRGVGFPGAGTPITAWPTQVEFLIYAPGTFVKGNGLTLDLGVIRDSTLNETNDFTAEWMEECWLIFQPGHESRRYSVNICADGTTGANDLTACDV
jgi:hypothetical protein